MEKSEAISLSTRLKQIKDCWKILYSRAEKQEAPPHNPQYPLSSLPPFPPPRTTLFSLPLEIRQQIYGHIIPRHRIVSVSNNRFDSSAIWPFAAFPSLSPSDPEPEPGWTKRHRQHTNLLRVSRQMSTETLDMLYGENCFTLYLTGSSTALQHFTARNRRRVRFLLLVSRGNWPGAGYKLNARLWGEMLPGLKILRLVIAQPYRTVPGEEFPIITREMDRWAQWMGGVLACFGGVLRGEGEVMVEVDCDGQKVTLDMVEGYLPRGWREVRCRHEGDAIFHRGKYTWWGEEFFDVGF